MPTQWLTPDEVLARIDQVPQEEWHDQGKEILKAVVEAWKNKGRVQEPEVEKSPYSKYLDKATRVGPKLTGAIRDSRGRRTCFQGGEHVPCDQFGGSGTGWTDLRAQEDLYDALRRLIDELKAGKHTGWHELMGLLIHTPIEELHALKEEHRLAAPPDVKEDLLQRVRQELQHAGHALDGEQPVNKGIYKTKAAGDETPKTPEPPKQTENTPEPHQEQPDLEPAQQQAAPIVPPAPTPPPDEPPQEPPHEPPQEPEREFINPIGTLWEREQPTEEHQEIQPPKLTKMDLSFYQSIKENPDDNAPRLIYADWLEDNNQPDRAEFMRIQIQLGDAKWVDYNYNPERIQELEKRQDELLASHREEWTWPWSQDEGTSSFRFRRGMLHLIDDANYFPRTLTRVSSEEEALANVEAVQLHGSALQIAYALRQGSSWLSHITSFSLQDMQLGRDFHLTREIANEIRRQGKNTLVNLNLRQTRFGSEPDGSGLYSLFSHGGMKKLEILNLSYNNLSDASIQHLIAFGMTPNNHIRRLDVRGNNLNQNQWYRLHEVFGSSLFPEL